LAALQMALTSGGAGHAMGPPDAWKPGRRTQRLSDEGFVNHACEDAGATFGIGCKK